MGRDEYDDRAGLTPIKFSRLTRRGVLLGLSGPQLAVVGTAAGSLILALYVGAVVLAVPVITACLSVAFLKIGGRTLVEWAPTATVWAWRSTGGQLTYRRRILKPRPAGTLALPGDAARLRQWVDVETGAVMMHDPHAATLTAIIGVTHPAFVLLDPSEQERRVVTCGRVLATACRSGRIASLQVMERTLPESGKGLADWWQRHGTHDDTWASRTYADLVDRAGPAGERHASTISISLDMQTANRSIRAAGGGMRGAAAVLRQEMATMAAALKSADLSPGDWLTPGDLALILRSAYDPAVAGALERHGDLGRDLATAGPVAVAESWGSLRSDSAHHCVLWISEWPRSLVFPGFLAPLLLSSGVRRTFTLLYTPMRTDRAARDIRKKKTEYISDAAQRQKIGQIEDAQQSAEYQDVSNKKPTSPPATESRASPVSSLSAPPIRTNSSAPSPLSSRQRSRHRAKLGDSGASRLRHSSQQHYRWPGASSDSKRPSTSRRTTDDLSLGAACSSQIPLETRDSGGIFCSRPAVKTPQCHWVR